MAATKSAFQRRYPPEMRERAVRLVREAIAESGERVGAVTRVARQLGMPRARTIVRPTALRDQSRTDRMPSSGPGFAVSPWTRSAFWSLTRSCAAELA